ncbi:MAG: HD domain-containing protein [Gemmatimonadales bacterium]|nr:MAG: HD domain-containing protein [Gemmatimonadales bacterium]
MSGSPRFQIIRDPLWNTIRLDPVAVRIVDTAAFQRLRYIRQLGFAHLVYPGATHTRFDHALGVYHLTVTALRLLEEREPLAPEAREGMDRLPYAALLHDIGHFAFSHALEELEADRLPGDHEAVSARFFRSPELARALEDLGPGAPEEIHDIIRGVSRHPLRGLVSGSLDLDKMEYLRRDARFCGVPYGEVDVDRLLQGLALLPDPDTGRLEVGIQEKALSALESLLFAKYQMFRNVYWHHAVRAATALYKRIVSEAVEMGLLESGELVGPTDEELLYEIRRRAQACDDPLAHRLGNHWIPALRNRRLPKRACELTPPELEGVALPPWVGEDSPERREVEDRLAGELGLGTGEVFIDFPGKSRMMELDLLVRRRGGRVERLRDGGLPGLLDLPAVAEELYRTTRVLRVFTLQPREVAPERVLSLLASRVEDASDPGFKARNTVAKGG